MALYFETTCEHYSPFGGSLVAAYVVCKVYEDVYGGRGQNPLNVVCWTHYIDVDSAETIVDGISRTANLNTTNFADGDQINIFGIPYVVVWVTEMMVDSVIVKRCYLMRHTTSAGT